MRSLFILCLTAVLLSGCGDSQNSATPSIPRASDAEQAAIKALTELGAVVATDEGGYASDVDLRKTTVDAALLEKLASLSSLRSLNVAETAFSDLRGCSLTDAAMPTIAEFTRMRVLRFSGKNGQTTISDDGLAALSTLKSLKVLSFDDLWISKPGLDHLTPLKDLEELYLAATIVDDEAIKTVAQFSGLRKLRLARTSIGDAALDSLKDSKTLEELDFSENSIITDAGMVSLASIKTLKKLNLWRVQISDTGALALAPLTNLTWLNLDNTKLSDTGLAALKDMNQLTFLHLGSTQITEAGAPDLFHLKSLRDLKITRTALGASETAVAELKQNLPNTIIQTEYEGQ
jgi:Leucine-rich repeat (LRR) protein